MEDQIKLLLEKLVDNQEKMIDLQKTLKVYTITGAADWPMLLALFGVISFMLLIIIYMLGSYHKDLRETLNHKDIEHNNFRTGCRAQIFRELDQIRSDLED